MVDSTFVMNITVTAGQVFQLYANGTNDFVATWGDGDSETVTTTNPTHTYTTAGDYTIEIDGNMTGLGMGDSDDDSKASITTVPQLGDVGLSTCTKMFWGCSNLTSVGADTDVFQPTNLYQAFQGCVSITIIYCSNWDTSICTTMLNTFYACTALNTLDVSGWDVSSLTTLYNTFRNCGNLGTLDVSSWDVSNVINLDYTFYLCEELTVIDLSTWLIPSTCSSMSGTFGYCSNVIIIDLSTLNTTNVVRLDSAFIGCSLLTTISFPTVGFPSVITLGNTFRDCDAIVELNLIGIFDPTIIISYSYTFGFMGALITLYLDDSFITSACTNTYAMFISTYVTNLDTSSWDLSNVTTADAMFLNANSTDITLDVSTWGMNSCLSINRTFSGFTNLVELTGLENWDISSVTSASNFLGSSQVSSETYSKVLDPELGWAKTGFSDDLVSIGFGNSQYSDEFPDPFWLDDDDNVTDKSFDDFADGTIKDQIFMDVSNDNKLTNIRTHNSALERKQLEVEKNITNN